MTDFTSLFKIAKENNISITLCHHEDLGNGIVLKRGVCTRCMYIPDNSSELVCAKALHKIVEDFPKEN